MLGIDLALTEIGTSAFQGPEKILIFGGICFDNSRVRKDNL